MFHVYEIFIYLKEEVKIDQQGERNSHLTESTRLKTGDRIRVSGTRARRHNHLTTVAT